MAESKIGDSVSVHYTAKLQDGTVIDSTEGREPLAFTAGSDEVIPGVSNAVVGMAEGDSKTIQVPPEEAYGLRREGQEQQVPRNLLPEDVKLGEPLWAKAGEQQVMVWITEINDEFATLDLNHPLAGETLTFELELVTLQPA